MIRKAFLVLACLVPVFLAGTEILIPKEALAVERFAAEELASHLKAAGIGNVRIVNEAGGTGECIRLGRASSLNISNLPANSARVKVAGSSVEIAGRDGAGEPLDMRVECGTLFGVYEFLERQLGVRWLWPGETGTFVPKRGRLDLSDADYVTGTPLAFAVWRLPGHVEGWSRRENAARFRQGERLWLRRHRFNTLEHCSYGHAFTSYMKKYHRDLPEIFNLLPDGTRRPDPLYFNGNPTLVSMCVSNPELVRLIVREWAKKPNNLVNVNENDTAGKCTCPSCLALDGNADTQRAARAKERFLRKDAQWWRELGCLSDRYAAFYLAVQKEAEKVNPSCRLIGDIYANYYEPPRKSKLNRRIIMRFCPPIMYPWTPAKVANFKRLWKGWADSGASLMLRPNFTLDGHNMPLLYHREYADCYDFARERGMLYSDLDSLTGMFASNGLTLYVIAAKNGGGRNKSLEELENDYLSAFGKAESMMREFVSLMAKASAMPVADNGNSIEGGNYADFFLEADRVFTPEIMKQGMALLAKAERAVADSPEELARVRFVKTGLADADIVLQTQRGYRKYRKNGDHRDFADGLRRLKAFREQNETLGYADLGVCAYLEGRHWPVHIAKLGDNSREIRNWRFRFDPEDVGTRNQWYSRLEGEWRPMTTDCHWEKTDLYKEYLASGGKPRVIGWYRCNFTVGVVNPTQKASLSFGAIDGDSDIYLNGELVRTREYPDRGNVNSWKEPFEVDVSGKLVSGENTLVIRVHKKEQYGGSSGIWRPVFITLGEAALPEMGVSAWRQNIQQGHFSVKKGAGYPLTITCTAPAENAVGAYRGVWGRFYRIETVEKGKTYEIRMRIKQTGTARFEAWLRTQKGALGEGNINLSAPNEDGAMCTLVGRVKAGSDKCAIYLNLMKGTGEVEIHSVQFGPVSAF